MAIAFALATASAAVEAVAAIAAVATMAVAGATATTHKAAQAKAAHSNGHSHKAGSQVTSIMVCCQFYLPLPCTTHAPLGVHNNDNDGSQEEDHGSNTNIYTTQHMCVDNGTQLHAPVHNNTLLSSRISAPDDVRNCNNAMQGNDTHAVHIALPHCCRSSKTTQHMFLDCGTEMRVHANDDNPLPTNMSAFNEVTLLNTSCLGNDAQPDSLHAHLCVLVQI